MTNEGLQDDLLAKLVVDARVDGRNDIEEHEAVQDLPVAHQEAKRDRPDVQTKSNSFESHQPEEAEGDVDGAQLVVEECLEHLECDRDEHERKWDHVVADRHVLVCVG